MRPLLQQIVALHGGPLEEEANHLLITLFLDSGHAGAALRHYGAFATLLHEAFDAEPAAATTALLRGLNASKHGEAQPVQMSHVVRPEAPLPLR